MMTLIVECRLYSKFSHNCTWAIDEYKNDVSSTYENYTVYLHIMDTCFKPVAKLLKYTNLLVSYTVHMKKNGISAIITPLLF